jgi:predicted nucleic acid-binding Zn ribbon protein
MSDDALTTDDTDPQPIGMAIDRLLHSLRAGDRRQVGGVFGRWEAAVGDAVAAHVTPVKLDGGVLTVVADEPGWATQVTFLTSELRARLAEVAGVDVERIEVRIAPSRR